MIEDLSRISLAVACFASSVVAVLIAFRGNRHFRYLMIFLAFWSTWFGIAMIVLAADRLVMPPRFDRWFVAGLNGSATATVGGWAVAGAWNYRRNVAAVRQAQRIADQ